MVSLETRFGLSSDLAPFLDQSERLLRTGQNTYSPDKGVFLC